MQTDKPVSAGGRYREWTSLLLIAILCFSFIVYLILYSDTSDSMKTFNLFKNVQGHPIFVQLSGQSTLFPWKESVRELRKNSTKPLLTLFTSWLDTEDKFVVHNITSVNWLALRPFVVPIVFTNEAAVEKVYTRAGWLVLPVRIAAADGVPVLKYMYLDAKKKFESDFYTYANSDILFTDSLLDTLIEILKYNSASHNSAEENSTLQHHTLIIGRRTNVYNMTMKEGSSWSEVTNVAREKGELFRSDAEDYFITSSSYPWNDIPEVVIGRRAYDNWLVLNARKQKHKVIDATDTILAVHQTTKDGNYEGMKKKTKEHNHNLLVTLYKNIQYGLGATECAEYQTIRNTGNISIIFRRNLATYCRLG
ncbi:hypothetical protein CHS0354_004163 [Potamilus streckersoni]|uniref:Uncharacterized protein n=1 Tax=Potamilus streckersoni TaxID=2493646 RepID=A0AAE0SZI5_9BIVA|nr:hypothetical protein CHS0354_004163 [Potamilus streckersoni]